MPVVKPNIVCIPVSAPLAPIPEFDIKSAIEDDIRDLVRGSIKDGACWKDLEGNPFRTVDEMAFEFDEATNSVIVSRKH